IPVDVAAAARPGHGIAAIQPLLAVLRVGDVVRADHRLFPAAAPGDLRAPDGATSIDDSGAGGGRARGKAPGDIMDVRASMVGNRWRLVGAAGIAAALSLNAGSALAQQKKGDAKAAPPAAAAPAAPAAAQNQSAWVKLCEKAPVLVKGADG